MSKLGQWRGTLVGSQEHGSYRQQLLSQSSKSLKGPLSWMEGVVPHGADVVQRGAGVGAEAGLGRSKTR